MSNIPSDWRIDVTCGGCGRKSKQALVRLQRDKKFVCQGCGATTQVTGEGLAKMDAAINKAKQEFAKLGRTVVAKLKF